MKQENLLLQLADQTNNLLQKSEELQKLDLETLNWKRSTEAWSILECLEHLNLYGDYYLPEMDKKIREEKAASSKPDFKSGLLGGYFAKSMLPKAKLNKMKTFKDKNPINSVLDKNVISRFVEQQNRLLNLLDNAKSVNLNKVKIETSISKWIKLNLGDTFQFYINHIIRHFEQIEKCKKRK